MAIEGVSINKSHRMTKRPEVEARISALLSRFSPLYRAVAVPKEGDARALAKMMSIVWPTQAGVCPTPPDSPLKEPLSVVPAM
jgi:hypothetical protein